MGIPFYFAQRFSLRFDRPCQWLENDRRSGWDLAAATGIDRPCPMGSGRPVDSKM